MATAGLSPKDATSIPVAATIVAALPSIQQQILSLVCGADYSYQAAADAMDIPVEQVRRHLLQARLALMARLPQVDAC